ncbi:MerR family transcriptional regulator [Vibrio natriegens]|jgi:MerR family mercuric resistance operon transcriptional regulator|uniref:MerR family transcriptional regulator n=1 Tax=Vibrio natriegens TaxID=691 RepID=UPI00080451D9|nr:MerR family transcriptional regulator [Vibrio natriegens]ANQ23782.1 MerR family transcriptional regulator [Vibrio natriegens]MCY9876931.1 MerR family transcriptional regulator [Vibrio natriegens]
MLTISKFAKAGGVSVETVRFYQRKGLLNVSERSGGIRRYDSDDLRRLKFIRKAQSAGFTLAEIKELLALDAGQDHHRAHELAKVRVEALDKKILELQEARDALKVLANQCKESKSGPCPILASFGI